jgi:Universal stress protein UspA and related nucleotide-binding proteins
MKGEVKVRLTSLIHDEGVIGMADLDPKKFKHILVGVDDSPDAQLAFRYAMNRAKEDDAEMTITSILESDDMNVYQALNKDFVHGKRDELEKHVLGYRDLAMRFGIKKVNVIIGEGNPGETIVKQIIPEVKPDLLIIGSLSKKGIRKRFGSQAAYMAKYAPISVLVIR